MITVEDGTGIEGANSYVSIMEFREYAADRAIELPESDAAVEALLHQAMDYLYVAARNLKGVETYKDQSLPFPRSVVDGYRWVETGIPNDLKRAQMSAAVAALDGPLISRTPASRTAQATEKTVGPITVRYASGTADTYPVSFMPEVRALLRKWLVGGVGQPNVVKG